MQCVAVARPTGLWISPGAPRKPGRCLRISPHAQGPVELPGGAYWWLGARNSGSLVYGENFILQRPKIGGEGLIPASNKNVSVQPYSPRRPSPPAVQPRQPMGLALSGVVVMDTDWEEVSNDLNKHSTAATAQLPPPSAPNTTCTGIVYVGSLESDTVTTQDMGISSGRHPRRTCLMKYTCNLCDHVNIKEVNPHAWHKGSVFARCEGCTAVHKLKDNLKIFHEMKGNVFPPRDLRDSFPAVKEIMDRINAKRRLQMYY